MLFFRVLDESCVASRSYGWFAQEHRLVIGLFSAEKDASVQQTVSDCLDSLDAAHQLPDTTTDLLGKMLVKIQTEGIRLMMANE